MEQAWFYVFMNGSGAGAAPQLSNYIAVNRTLYATRYNMSSGVHLIY
jgi:hypothetical protein